MLRKLIVVFLLFYVTITQLALCHPSALNDKLKSNVQGKVQNFDGYLIAPPSLTDQSEEIEDGKDQQIEYEGLTQLNQTKLQNPKSTKPTKKNGQRLRRHGNNGQNFGQQHQNIQTQQPNQIPCYNGQPITLLQPYSLLPCAPQEQQANVQQNNGAYAQPSQFYGQQQRQLNPNMGSYNTGFSHQHGHGWHHWVFV